MAEPAVDSPAERVLLSLRGVERAWGKRPILTGVDLELSAGSVSWLGGVNGVGKTTMLRIAAGLIAPHRGTVKLDGLDPVADRRAYQSRLGFLSAGDRGLYARLSVTRNLEFWTGLALLERSQRGPAVQRVIGLMELEELRHQRVDRLSMGQRQRVRLAMVLLHEPRVLLLDEPHTSLDDHGIDLLRSALDAHVARGGAALWCSPALAQAALPHDHTWVLRDGVLVAT